MRFSLFSENNANDRDYRDIMKLTALFTARRGRSFLASLLAREGRNYSLSSLVRLGYFNRLVEQYPKVLHPNKAMLEQLKNHMQEGAWWMTLGVARNHAKWERNKWEKDKRRQDDQCIPVAWASQPQRPPTPSRASRIQSTLSTSTPPCPCAHDGTVNATYWILLAKLYWR